MKPSILYLISSLAIASLSLAQSPEEKGYAIAKASDESDNGFADTRVKIKMTLSNANGKKTERILRIDTLERANNKEGDKSVVSTALTRTN